MKKLYYGVLILVVVVAVYKYAEIAFVTFAVESAIHHIHKGL